MIRVFVAGPTAALRLGLRARLEGPGITVVGDGATLEGAPAEVDVVVLADAERLPVSADALGDGDARAVVALVDGGRPLPSLPGLALRGWALVSRDASAAELRAATTAAAEGFAVLPARLAHAPAPGRGASAAAPRPDPTLEPLTPRERETLELLAQGLSNREIGERLVISEHTAKFHVASIAAKLGASSRTEAVTLGVRRGLITL